MIFSSNVQPIWNTEMNAILQRSWERFLRDVNMTLCSNQKQPACFVHITIDSNLPAEAYHIRISEQSFFLSGGDELGIIYALLFLSEHYLGITPFWYWNQQNFIPKSFLIISPAEYISPEYKLRFRGWFINDEVLLDAWGKDCDKNGIIENEAFEMVMEACLRLGGNMIIPGTDRNSHKYHALAASMGLWITHHHAEPLGAEMFTRVYPDLVPSYQQYANLFEELWRSAIKRQLHDKIIWNIGFRGQGDRPFWADDPIYDTPEKRGVLISSLIQRQYDILCEYIDQPICCTNLYGEIMELYQQGFITLPEQIIYIWADNGYGKMVSRRQGKHNPRIPALPATRNGQHGIYYHASFYDLQAGSHITLLPNSTGFVKQELEHSIEKGVHAFLLVNCSNVRPHTYMLDYIAHIWGKQAPDYTKVYFPNYADDIEMLYQRYFTSTIKYGCHEDEHAGEQFYHYTMRSICHGWLLGKFDSREPGLEWLTGALSLDEQVSYIQNLIVEHFNTMKLYHQQCVDYGKKMVSLASAPFNEDILFRDSLLLQAEIHYISLVAQQKLCESYSLFRQNEFTQAFVRVGQAIEQLQQIISSMEQADHEKWKGFYDNDCLTDIKFTAYILSHIMSYIRNVDDGPHFYQWQLKYMGNFKHDKVVLITNMRNHSKDWELYLAMKSLSEFK